MIPYSSSSIIWVLEATRSFDWFEKTVFTPWMRGQACAPTSEGVHANAFSLAATVKITV